MQATPAIREITRLADVRKAVVKGDVDRVRWLLLDVPRWKAAIVINTARANGPSVLGEAVQGSRRRKPTAARVRLIKLLLRMGGKLAVGGHMMQPLYLAAANPGASHLVPLLLTHPAVTAEDRQAALKDNVLGPLSVATVNGDLHVARMLVEAGACPWRDMGMGITPGTLALRCGPVKMAAYFLGKMRPEHASEHGPACVAAALKHPASKRFVGELLDMGCDPAMACRLRSGHVQKLRVLRDMQAALSDPDPARRRRAQQVYRPVTGRRREARRALPTPAIDTSSEAGRYLNLVVGALPQDAFAELVAMMG